MAQNQSWNTTTSTPTTSTDYSLPFATRFWILLVFDVSSTICTFVVLFYVSFDRKLRSNAKNHTLVVLLMLGLSVQLIDIPFYLNFIVHSSVVPANPSVCLIWWFIDIGIYNGVTILLAWTALERHILVFHDQWISTRKKRVFVHYLPLLFLILYIFVYYIYAIYGFPCQNSYDYTSIVCNESPCYENDPVMRMWDLLANNIIPALLEPILSFCFLFRVIWHKKRSNLPIQWRKQRKMMIQLLCLSSLNLAFNVPLNIIQIGHLCGLPQSVGAEATQYFFFLTYFVIFTFPFICFASIGGVNRGFQTTVFRRRPKIRQLTATVRPEGVRTALTMRQ